MAFLRAQRKFFLLTVLTCTHILMTSSEGACNDQTVPSSNSTSWDGVTRACVDTENSTYSTDLWFLSTMFGSNLFKRAPQYNCDFTAEKMKSMGSAMAPLTVRIGGTPSHYIIFDPTNTADQSELKEDQFYMTAEEWDVFTNFTRDVGWDIMFNVNLFMWENETLREVWDPANTKLLLDYSAQRGVNLSYFQIGNEVTAYAYNFDLDLDPGEYVKHHVDLRKVLDTFPMYRASGLVGPDANDLYERSYARTFVKDFMEQGGAETIDAVGQHQYYCNGRTATVDEFLSVAKMEELTIMIEYLAAAVHPTKPDMPLWLSETSSCFGGGAKDLSNGYVAGFLWLDKLGVSAKYGVSRVMRQLYCGPAYYALINSDLFPWPDYFLSVLYKRLVLGPVLNITLEPENPKLRIYGHCARQDVYDYPPGAVVVYYLNTEATNITIDLPQFGDVELDLYMLTPSNISDLSSKFVNLNNVTLEMEGDDLPQMTAVSYTGPLTVPGSTFGFIVVPQAKVPLCGYTPPPSTQTPTATTVDGDPSAGPASLHVPPQHSVTLFCTMVAFLVLRLAVNLHPHGVL